MKDGAISLLPICVERSSYKATWTKVTSGCEGIATLQIRDLTWAHVFIIFFLKVCTTLKGQPHIVAHHALVWYQKETLFSHPLSLHCTKDFRYDYLFFRPIHTIFYFLPKNLNFIALESASQKAVWYSMCRTDVLWISLRNVKTLLTNSDNDVIKLEWWLRSIFFYSSWSCTICPVDLNSMLF